MAQQMDTYSQWFSQGRNLWYQVRVKTSGPRKNPRPGIRFYGSKPRLGRRNKNGFQVESRDFVAAGRPYGGTANVRNRGAARTRPKKPCPPKKKNLLRFFAGVLYQSQLFENKRKEQSDSCSVVFSHWPRFNVAFCDWLRNYTTKTCNFVSKVAN